MMSLIIVFGFPIKFTTISLHFFLFGKGGGGGGVKPNTVYSNYVYF